MYKNTQSYLLKEYYTTVHTLMRLSYMHSLLVHQS